MRSTGAAAPACLLPAATRLRPTWAQNQTSPAASCFDGRLGLLLDAGFGMKMNAALAFEKYIIAAQVPCSNVRAASVCRQHRGLPPFFRTEWDKGAPAPALAPRMLTACVCAGQAGIAQAQFNIGVAFDKGKVVQPSAETAVHWYGLASKQDLAEAQVRQRRAYASVCCRSNDRSIDFHFAHFA